VLTSARELLDWQPKTELEAGVTKTVDYFRTRLNTQKQETHR
jgi:nucleoside-diphosphate-sugar epimerase